MVRPLGRSLDQIFREVLEEYGVAFTRRNEVRLKPDGVDGIERKRRGWSLVGRDLPLVITDHSELNQVFPDRKHRSEAPLHREGIMLVPFFVP